MKKSALWKLSEQLIAIDTVSFKPNAEAAALISQKLNDLGFTVKVEYYLDPHGHKKEQVIAWIGPEVEGGLILSGHIDTVPFANQPGWERDALKLEIENDKVYGRGTCDMKLFIAQCLIAFEEIDLSKLQKPIVCIFTSDEEVGCHGAHHLTSELKTIMDNMPLPKRAIIGEPTSYEVINTHKGVVQFNLDISGVAGHSSRPDLGLNAISPLGKIITLINDMNFQMENNINAEFKKLFPDFPYNFLHAAVINAGLANNMIPEFCRLQISYRCFPGEKELKLFEEFQNNLEEFNFYNRLSFNDVQVTPAMPLAKSIELENTLKEYAGKETRSVSFATDGGFLSKLGIECYVCGPGEIKMAHQPNEFMSLDDFVDGPFFIKTILNKLLF
jgi:acetylornithine deacetylase